MLEDEVAYVRRREFAWRRLTCIREDLRRVAMIPLSALCLVMATDLWFFQG